MKRLFFTVGKKKYPFGCSYCFTEFNDYISPPSIYSVFDGSISIEGIDIIYPACDIEFFCLSNWKEILNNLVKLNKIIVISTKSILNDEDIDFLYEKYKELLSNGGFLKIGISITTKFRVNEIEPKTPCYVGRLETAKKIFYKKIPVCLIMKPLLVEIENEELGSILSDFQDIANIILIGDEYIDSILPRNPDLFNKNNIETFKKNVNWKFGSENWKARKSKKQIQYLLEVSYNYTLPIAISDVDAVQFLIKKYKGGEG